MVPPPPPPRATANQAGQREKYLALHPPSRTDRFGWTGSPPINGEHLSTPSLPHPHSLRHPIRDSGVCPVAPQQPPHPASPCDRFLKCVCVTSLWNSLVPHSLRRPTQADIRLFFLLCANWIPSRCGARTLRASTDRDQNTAVSKNDRFHNSSRTLGSPEIT